MTSQTPSSQDPHGGSGSRSRQTLAVRMPPAAVIAAWRQQAVQAEILNYLAAAGEPLDPARRPGGTTADRQAWTWHEEDALGVGQVRLVSDRCDAPVRTAELSVLPAAAEYGTEATLVLYHTLLPGSSPEALAGRALRQLKALLESGEIPLPPRTWQDRRRPASRQGAANDTSVQPRRTPQAGAAAR